MSIAWVVSLTLQGRGSTSATFSFTPHLLLLRANGAGPTSGHSRMKSSCFHYPPRMINCGMLILSQEFGNVSFCIHQWARFITPTTSNPCDLPWLLPLRSSQLQLHTWFHSSAADLELAKWHMAGPGKAWILQGLGTCFWMWNSYCTIYPLFDDNLGGYPRTHGKLQVTHGFL